MIDDWFAGAGPGKRSPSGRLAAASGRGVVVEKDAGEGHLDFPLPSESRPAAERCLLPTFLTSTLGAGPAALGAIDGVADALTGVCKLAGGPLANDPDRRGRLAAGGHLGTAVATAAIGLTVAVWRVAVLRSFAWISRGNRSPARDMLLTDLSARDTYGRAFGVERAGDNAGAIIGPCWRPPWCR